MSRLLLALAVALSFGPMCDPAGMKQVAADPADLVVEDRAPGTGEPVKEGDHVAYFYTVRLLGSTEVLDSNVGKELYRVRIGDRAVIAGMEQGLVGMRVGGKRRLVVPSRLAYGEKGKPPAVPPRAPLEFEVELAAIGAPPPK